MQLDFGRPRGGGRALVEDLPRVDLRHALRRGAPRHGWLDAGRTGGGVRYDLDLDAKILDLGTDVAGRAVAARVGLTSQEMPQGRGVRWTAVCPRPGCGRRCVILFVTEDPFAPFACRGCMDVAYRVEHLTQAGRLALKARRLRERVAGPDAGPISDPFPSRAQTMGKTEHQRLRQRHDRAVVQYRELVRARIARLVQRHAAKQVDPPLRLVGTN